MNLALCYLKIGAYSEVITYANKILDVQPQNVKAIYRRAIAYLHRGSFDEAKSDLLLANELCPNDPSIKEGFKLYKQKKAEYHEKSKRIASQVFNKKESEEALKERQVFEQPPREEDIPSLLNRVIKFLLALPLIFYNFCFEGCVRRGLGCIDGVF